MQAADSCLAYPPLDKPSSSEDKLQAYPSYLWDAAARHGWHEPGWGSGLSKGVEWHSGDAPGHGSTPGTSTVPEKVTGAVFLVDIALGSGGIVGLLGFGAVEEVPQIEVGAEEKGDTSALRLDPCS